jgi:hypothetical protein
VEVGAGTDWPASLCRAASWAWSVASSAFKELVDEDTVDVSGTRVLVALAIVGTVVVVAGATDPSPPPVTTLGVGAGIGEKLAVIVWPVKTLGKVNELTAPTDLSSTVTFATSYPRAAVMVKVSSAPLGTFWVPGVMVPFVPCVTVMRYDDPPPGTAVVNVLAFAQFWVVGVTV